MPLERVVRAVYAYDAVEEDELSFAEEDLLAVMPTDNDEWLMASKLDESSASGLVPINYIEDVLHVLSFVARVHGNDAGGVRL